MLCRAPIATRASPPWRSIIWHGITQDRQCMAIKIFRGRGMNVNVPTCSDECRCMHSSQRTRPARTRAYRAIAHTAHKGTSTAAHPRANPGLGRRTRTPVTWRALFNCPRACASTPAARSPLHPSCATAPCLSTSTSTAPALECASGRAARGGRSTARGRGLTAGPHLTQAPSHRPPHGHLRKRAPSGFGGEVGGGTTPRVVLVRALGPSL